MVHLLHGVDARVYCEVYRMTHSRCCGIYLLINLIRADIGVRCNELVPRHPQAYDDILIWQPQGRRLARYCARLMSHKFKGTLQPLRMRASCYSQRPGDLPAAAD